MGFKDPQGQVARWLEVLGTYHFTIEHRAGLKHGNADALSRGPCRQCGMDDSTENACKVVTRSAAKNQPMASQAEPDPSTPDPWTGVGDLSVGPLATAQKSDPVLSKLLAWREAGDRPPWIKVSAEGLDLKVYWAQWDSLTQKDGLLCRKLHMDRGPDRIQVLLPTSLQEQALQQCHDAVTAGHMGIRRTLASVRARFFWPRMRKAVERWCRDCTICASRKHPNQKRRGPLQKYQMGLPMERVALDITGPWPVSHEGNRYVLVVSDYFTKWSEAYPIPDQEAKTVAETFVKQFIARFGAPLLVHTDQGTNFQSRLFREMCALMGVKKTRTTAFHPQSDGQVENFNKTLGTMIAAFVTENQKTWDRDLAVLMMAYRATPHESTKMTPNMLMLGREVSMPLDIQIGLAPEMETQEETEYAEELRIRLENAYLAARENLGVSAERQKRYYDLKALDQPYSIGDLAWLINKSRRKGRCPKLQKKWLGPVVVEQKLNDVTYRIRTSKQDSKVVHFDLLKPYVSSNVPEWALSLQAKLKSP